MGKWGTIILFVWLIFGSLAAVQRGYFNAANIGCTQGLTIALTIAAGPLNYFGLDPTVSCSTPKPAGT
jgi:hypothetical protein